ncbi:MAG TPA: hypothetical protein DEA27_04715 [Candidatus Moranbacteria bacterium]|nr:hypothetical protein [Candidatus Moranbacteria bacterium]
MKNRSVVIRSKACFGQPQTKIKIQEKMSASGFVNPVVSVVVLGIFAGLLYVYSINQSAVKGFQMKKVEKEITQLKNENELLKIKEAELKSLYKIEQSSKDLNMLEVAEIKYLDETNSLALNSSVKNIK